MCVAYVHVQTALLLAARDGTGEEGASVNNVIFIRMTTLHYTPAREPQSD